MPALSEYSNVYDVAIGVLEKKGFQVWFDRGRDMFFCEKNGWDFSSESPCGLLGLVAIYEQVAPEGYSEYWWTMPTQTTHRSLPSSPTTYKPVWDVPPQGES
jgi:hypothetical protein